MDIKQLHYFTTVVEEKTVTAAAEKLHMTQPPLTMQLHALESELGCKLFERKGRTLSLTDAGQHMYRRALEIIGMCDNAQREMKDYRNGTVGTLRIGVISSVQGTLFTKILKEYHDRYPNIKISVFSANTYQLLEKLQNREIDTAITRTPFSAAKLHAEYLRTEEIHAIGKSEFFGKAAAGGSAVTPANNAGALIIPAKVAGDSAVTPANSAGAHITPRTNADGNVRTTNFAGSTDITLAELARLPLIIYRRWQKVIESVFESAGLSPNICCVNDDARMTLLLAFNGLGVGLLHPSAIPSEYGGDISVMRLPEKALTSRIALVCADKDSLPEPAALFHRLVKAAL